jgi:hypothetical protein
LDNIPIGARGLARLPAAGAASSSAPSGPPSHLTAALDSVARAYNAARHAQKLAAAAAEAFGSEAEVLLETRAALEAMRNAQR